MRGFHIWSQKLVLMIFDPHFRQKHRQNRCFVKNSQNRDFYYFWVVYQPKQGQNISQYSETTFGILSSMRTLQTKKKKRNENFIFCLPLVFSKILSLVREQKKQFYGTKWHCFLIHIPWHGISSETLEKVEFGAKWNALMHDHEFSEMATELLGGSRWNFALLIGHPLRNFCRKKIDRVSLVTELWYHKRDDLPSIFHWYRVFSNLTCCRSLEWRRYAWFRSEDDCIWSLVLHLDLLKVIWYQWLWLALCLPNMCPLIIWTKFNAIQLYCILSYWPKMSCIFDGFVTFYLTLIKQRGDTRFAWALMRALTSLITVGSTHVVRNVGVFGIRCRSSTSEVVTHRSLHISCPRIAQKSFTRRSWSILQFAGIFLPYDHGQETSRKEIVPRALCLAASSGQRW